MVIYSIIVLKIILLHKIKHPNPFFAVVPDTIKQVLICENNRRTLKCPKGTYLMIADAFYGREDKTTCPHPNIIDTDCSAKNVLDIVSAR